VHLIITIYASGAMKLITGDNLCYTHCPLRATYNFQITGHTLPSRWQYRTHTSNHSDRWSLYITTASNNTTISSYNFAWSEEFVWR